MYKGITPTFTLVLPEGIDLSGANNVYVTFADRKGKTLLTKETADIDIDENEIGVYLTQAETLGFPSGQVMIQVNWTYDQGGEIKRDCTEIGSVFWKNNLLNEVIE